MGADDPPDESTSAPPTPGATDEGEGEPPISCGAPDATEPNDAAVDAVALNDSTTGRLCPEDRVDMFHVDISELPYRLRAELELESSLNQSVTLALIGLDGEQVLASETEDAGVQVSADVEAPGRYFVKLRLSDDQGASVVPYTLRWHQDRSCRVSGCAVALDGSPLAEIYVNALAYENDSPSWDIPFWAPDGCLAEARIDAEPAWYFQFIATQSSTRAQQERFIRCVNREHIELGALALPDVGALVPVEGLATLAIDDVLSLETGAVALDFPLGLEESLGGVRVPTSWWPYDAVSGAPVLATWAFAPWGVKSKEAMGIEIQDSLGLSSGDTVGFWTLGSRDVVLEGEPEYESKGVFDGTTIRPVSGGIRRLSWLLVTRGE
ncbi:MAG: hypothetical protein V3V08_00550 [Nannocystaceae bacterium]